jgi:hypothetical protein
VISVDREQVGEYKSIEGVGCVKSVGRTAPGHVLYLMMYEKFERTSARMNMENSNTSRIE